MESYRILYRIRIGHDYFDGKPCPALQCRLTPRGEALAYRRGLLFRQTAPGEWTLLFRQEPDTKNDVLSLDLFVADPKFTLYTAWDGFQPSAAYSLELPAAEETVEAATAIRTTGNKRAIGSGFCTLHLRLTDELVKAAGAGRPMQAVLHFKEAAVQWEYLFIPIGEQTVPPSHLQCAVHRLQGMRGIRAEGMAHPVEVARSDAPSLPLQTAPHGTERRQAEARVAVASGTARTRTLPRRATGHPPAGLLLLDFGEPKIYV